jgi:hypothetical protein
MNPIHITPSLPRTTIFVLTYQSTSSDLRSKSTGKLKTQWSKIIMPEHADSVLVKVLDEALAKQKKKLARQEDTCKQTQLVIRSLEAQIAGLARSNTQENR